MSNFNAEEMKIITHDALNKEAQTFEKKGLPLWVTSQIERSARKGSSEIWISYPNYELSTAHISAIKKFLVQKGFHISNKQNRIDGFQRFLVLT